MAESPREIEADIDRTRQAVAGNVRELRDRLHDAVDVRKAVQRAPYATAGVLLGVGIVAALWMSRRKSPYAAPREPAPYRESVLGRELRAIPEVGHMKQAMIAVATSRLVSHLNGWLPGFADEFQRSQSRDETGGSAAPVMSMR